MSDVLVTFERGAVASLEIDDVLYTGQIFTLFAWLAEFVSKRRRGLSLRERLPGDATNPDESLEGSFRGGAPGSAARATLLRQSSGFHRRGAESAGANPGNFAGNLTLETSAATAPSTARSSSPSWRAAFPDADRDVDPTSPTWAAGVGYGAGWNPSAADSPPSRNGVGLRRTASGNLTAATARQHTGEDTSSTRGAAASAAAMIHLNIPVLVAGVRVAFRDAERAGEDADDAEEKRNDAEEKRNDAEEKGNSTPLSTPTPRDSCSGRRRGSGYSFATWQLVKGFARFVEVTVTDAEVDARAVGGGSHFARRVAIAARAGTGAKGLVASVVADEIRGVDVGKRTDRGSNPNAREGEDDERGDDALEGGALRAVNARLHLTARYRSSVGTVAIVAAEADVAELDVEEPENEDDEDGGSVEASSEASDGGSVEASSEASDGGSVEASSPPKTPSRKSIASSSIANRLRSIPATVSIRFGRVRARRPTLFASAANASLECRREDGDAAAKRQSRRGEKSEKRDSAAAGDRTVVVARCGECVVAGGGDDAEDTAARAKVAFGVGDGRRATRRRRRGRKTKPAHGDVSRERRRRGRVQRSETRARDGAFSSIADRGEREGDRPRPRTIAYASAMDLGRGRVVHGRGTRARVRRRRRGARRGGGANDRSHRRTPRRAARRTRRRSRARTRATIRRRRRTRRRPTKSRDERSPRRSS